MKQDFDFTEFIERYLQDEMYPEEKNWFEKEIEGNLELKQEIDLRRKVDSVLEDKELIELKAQLEQIHKEIYEVTENGKSTIRQIYRRVYLTAGALAIFSMAFTFYMTNRNFSNDKLLDLYYQPAKVSMSYRTADVAKNKLNEAIVLYNNTMYAAGKNITGINTFKKIYENKKGMYIKTNNKRMYL